MDGLVVALGSGFLAGRGYFSASAVLIMLATGEIIGDTLYYLLGKIGARKGVLVKWGRYVGVTPERLAYVEGQYRNRGATVLVLGKFYHGLGLIILMAAGAVSMPYGKFFRVNFLATLPKVIVLFLLGYHFGKAYTGFSSGLKAVDEGFWILGLLILLGYFGGRYAKKRYFR
jgi:membrane-associated protein